MDYLRRGGIINSRFPYISTYQDDSNLGRHRMSVKRIFNSIPLELLLGVVTTL
jgi:hypothetical protein